MSKQPIALLCAKLKSGDYDGVDIMEARIYLQELEQARKQEPVVKGGQPLGQTGWPVADEWVDYYKSRGCPYGVTQELYALHPDIAHIQQENERLRKELAEAKKGLEEGGKDQIEACVYCGSRRPENRAISCCGENHFALTDEE